MSNINFESINEAFPANGKDNSTQGFRDNFNTIKQNFQYAKAEIEALQDFSVSTDKNNNFNGNSILNVNLSQYTEQTNTTALSGVGADFNVSYIFGQVHALKIIKSLNLNFTDWPTKSNLAKIKLVLFGDGTQRQVSFTTTNGTIKKHEDFPSSLILTSATNPVIVEAWTLDKGVTVYLDYKGTYT